ncbi:hypothetical protein D3C86_765200 [compost metagenome]
MLARADRAVHRPVRRQVIFGAQRARPFLGFPVGPGREEIAARVGRGTDVHARRRREQQAAARVGGAVLVVDVAIHAEAFALVIQAQRHRAQVFLGAVLGQVTAAAGHVQAHAPFLAVAVAARQVGVGTELRVADVAQGVAVQRFVSGAFGHQVDRPAHRAVRRHAVEQRVGTAQHFHALDTDQRTGVARRHAIQAVERHVVVKQREAADVEFVAPRAARIGVAHRRVVDQHVADVLRLLVFDQLGGVLRGAEGRVHVAHIAQQADAAARGHLAARIGGRQAAAQRAAGHGNGFQRGGARLGDGGQAELVGRLARGAQAGAGQGLAQGVGAGIASAHAAALAACQQLRRGGQQDAGFIGQAGQHLPHGGGGYVERQQFAGLAGARGRRLGMQGRRPDRRQGEGQRQRGGGGKTRGHDGTCARLRKRKRKLAMSCVAGTLTFLNRTCLQNPEPPCEFF